jgi:hypothetical protein
MGKRVIRSIAMKYKNTEDLNNQVNLFLDEKTTGEIYDLEVSNFSAADHLSTIVYTFLYEYLNEEDISKDEVKQRKISEIKESKSKPKLL